jgi:hypothetical protein
MFCIRRESVKKDFFCSPVYHPGDIRGDTFLFMVVSFVAFTHQWTCRCCFPLATARLRFFTALTMQTGISDRPSCSSVLWRQFMGVFCIVVKCFTGTKEQYPPFTEKSDFSIQVACHFLPLFLAMITQHHHFASLHFHIQASLELHMFLCR